MKKISFRARELHYAFAAWLVSTPSVVLFVVAVLAMSFPFDQF